MMNSLTYFSTVNSAYGSYNYDAQKHNAWIELQLQKEAKSLSSKYKPYLQTEDLNNSQFKQSQFLTMSNAISMDLQNHQHFYRKHEHFSNKSSIFNPTSQNLKGFDSTYQSGTQYVQTSGADVFCNVNSLAFHKIPLQQQLFQYRLLQQKKQLFQKRFTLDPNQQQAIIREQNYKLSNHQLQSVSLVSSPKDEFFQNVNAFGSRTKFQQYLTSPPLIAHNLQSANTILKTSYINQQSQITPVLTIKCPVSNRISSEKWNSLPQALNACHLKKSNRLDMGRISSFLNPSPPPTLISQNWQTLIKPLRERPILEIAEHMESV
ncbi:uncharacterized protein LOC119676446 [Teleopsis dalmanni]|uniref:uncharacterized protein LOC119676446 n=2 Tax=Teleopsis dalmanni TaxID=139649 RepID=UPI0018CD62D9|nr:uncharacterized protein LOC119676446 [Teleopsis dalmanni]